MYPDNDREQAPQDILTRYETLQRVSRCLAEQDDIKAVLQTIADIGASVVEANLVTIHSLDLEQQKVKLIVRGGRSASEIGSAEDYRNESFDQAYNDSAVWTLKSRSFDQDKNRDQPIMPGEQNGAFRGKTISAPIIFCERIFGVIKAYNPARQALFTKYDESFLISLSNLAALAVENERVKRTERQQRRQAETLREVARILNYSLDQQQVLELILDQLARVVDYDRASIMLISDQQARMIVQRNLRAIEEKKLPQQFLDYPYMQEILERRRPIIIDDIQLDSQWQVIQPGNTFRSWLGVPLIGRDQVIGFLNLEKEQPGYYSPQDAVLSVTFASQAAIAIENARLYQSAREAAERRATLHQVSQAIVTASLQAEEIYSAVHHAAERLMQVEAFTIVRYADVNRLYTLGYRVDRGGRVHKQAASGKCDLSSLVISTGKSHYLANTSESRIQSDFIQIADPELVSSILAVPMRLRGKVVGMLVVQSFHTDAYTKEDMYLLEMLSSYTAIALDNAILFQGIQKLAITDPLTGVHNRRHLFELGRREFQRAKRYQRPLSAVMVDIDRFKSINDQFGHAMGDKVLLKLSGLLKNGVREFDIVGRYGGEEFVILLPETSLSATFEVAERLRILISKAFENTELPIVSVSMGVASSKPETPDLDALVHIADIAMYAAKKTGGNRVALM